MSEAGIDPGTSVLFSTLFEGRTVDTDLAEGGRLYVDRPVPFICIYRHSDATGDRVTERLVTTLPSYAIGAHSEHADGELASHIDVLADVMAEHFGGFLVLEIWCRRDDLQTDDPYALQPELRITAPDSAELQSTVEMLERGLQWIRIHDFSADVTIAFDGRPAPAGRAPLAGESDSTYLVGLEIAPVFQNAKTGDIYPFLFVNFRSQLAEALRKGFFAFSKDLTCYEAPSFLALGRRALENAVSRVDESLADIGESLDFLLQMTPVNAEDARADFMTSGCERDPVFRYRPLPIDPTLVKRRLYALPIERVEDPTLSDLFREKQEELDRKITMLCDRGSRQFFFESLQLYGEVSSQLLEEARDLLDRLPPSNYDLASAKHLDAEAFAEIAADELRHYRQAYPEFPKTVHIRHDMPPGLMVSRGRLLIGHQTKIPAPRVEALLHHEVGTHMLTYFNGRVQPLHLLYNGLAGYDALQEGLAVLSEFLVDGLHVPRLRVLAARVVAAHCMIEGCTFVDLYRLLRSGYGFEELEAFSLALRTFRGGGLIKDVIYLRGLHEIMTYLQYGGDLNALFVGKIALRHLPVLDELRDRGILQHVPLTPRYLMDDRVESRLNMVRQGSTVIDLIEHRDS